MDNIAMVLAVLLSACLVIAGVAWVSGWSQRQRVGLGLACLVAYAVVLVTRPASWAVSDASVLIVAIGLAPLLGQSLGSAGSIAAFAVTASAVDILSFGGGLTREIIQGHQAGTSDLLRFLAVTVPVAGQPRPLVGVVDLLLMGALFLGLVRVHGGRRRAGVVLLVGLASAVITGLVVGGIAAVPFIGFAAAADAALAKGSRKLTGRSEGRADSTTGRPG